MSLRLYCILVLLSMSALSMMACVGSRAAFPSPTLPFVSPVTRLLATLEIPSTRIPARVSVPAIQPTAAIPCLSSRDAVKHLGETVCVRGNVMRTYATTRAFFIEFDTPGTGFFATSLTTGWEIPQGACLQIIGTLLDWQGRAYVVLDADEVRFCDSAVMPYRIALAQTTAIPSRILPTPRPPQIVATQASVPSNAQIVEGRVVHVVDGDTIDVNLGGKIFRVRYIGVDTPETVHPSQPVECMGREASAFNKQLVEGKIVRLEKDISETDKYGRLLRYIYVGETFVNAELVRQGLAQVSTYPPDVKYQDLYLQLQREARAAGRGLWGGACESFAVPPATVVSAPPSGNCDPSYPDVCIPPYPPDLDCGDIPFRRFQVIGADPHRFDGDKDGIGCESG